MYFISYFIYYIYGGHEGNVAICHANFSSSRSPKNFICSKSVGVPVRLILVLFSTNAFSGISGIFGDELNTESLFWIQLATIRWCIAMCVLVLIHNLFQVTIHNLS